MTINFLKNSYVFLSSLLVSSLFSLNVLAQSPNVVSGFIRPDSLYFSIEDRNNDGIVDKFQITTYSTKKLSSFIYKDSSNSFQQISKSSSTVFENQFFEDNDFNGSFEEKYFFEKSSDGSLIKVPKVHMDESFISPFKYFPEGTYVLKNSFFQIGAVFNDKTLGSLKYGTLSVNDNTLDGLVDEYFFQLNYVSGIVQIELKDRDANKFFEFAKIYIYDSNFKLISNEDFSNANNFVSYLSKLPEDRYLISSLGEIVKKIK